MPNRVSKHQVLAQLGRGHVRREMGKSERVEGQISLHTTSDTTGYLCLATLLSLNELYISAARFDSHVVQKISSDIYNLVNRYTGTPSLCHFFRISLSLSLSHTHTHIHTHTHMCANPTNLNFRGSKE
jgi:hypothetical protein